MEFIAKDKGGDWHYEDGIYCCLDKDNALVGRIAEEYIPDPVKLMESKCKAAGVDVRSPEAKNYKSNDVIYKLWEHRNANANE